MKKNKILIVVISIIIIIGLIAGTLAYLMFATDTFKSEKELFTKYAMQNIDIVKQLMNCETINTYKNLENENAYDSEATINFQYSEGGEVSNPINNLSLKLNAMKNEENEYFYGDAQLSYEDESYLRGELIRDKELVGIRFSDVVRQFVTIRDDDDIGTVAEVLGVDIEDLQMIIQTMQGSKELIDEYNPSEEIKQTTQKYLNILKNGILNATFSKIKNVTVTVNNNPIQANSYIARISKEQTRQIITEILNNVKEDEFILKVVTNSIEEEKFVQKIEDMIENLSLNETIPEIQIAVYVEKGVTVQTTIVIGQQKIIICNKQAQNQINMDVLYKDEDANEHSIQMIKNNTENSENYDIKIKTLMEEQGVQINIIDEMNKQGEEIDASLKLELIEGITSKSLNIDISTMIGSDFENEMVLEEDNNVILNDIEKELLANRMEYLKNLISARVTENWGNLTEKLTTDNQEAERDPAQSQIEINNFNSNIEFYTGDSVSGENVRTLLDIVKNNLNSVEFLKEENEDAQIYQANELLRVKLEIEKGKQNAELINPVLEKIEDRKKYRVSVTYKEENGIIDYVVIEEIK